MDEKHILRLFCIINVLNTLRSVQSQHFGISTEPPDNIVFATIAEFLTTVFGPETQNDEPETSVSTAIANGEAVIEDFILRYQTTNLVDLIFVVDRSGSVPDKGWGAITGFMRDILRHFTVDKDNTRVAVVTYSSAASVDINDLESHYLNNLENKCTLNTRIKNLIEPQVPYGYTATNAALEQVYEIIQDARNNSKKAVFVLTDGRSNVGPPPVKAAFKIQSLRWDANWDESLNGPQVEIYAFGIENAYIPELNSIASPLPNHTFLIPSFEAFEEFARSLHGGKQVERWLETNNASECGYCMDVYSKCLCGSKSGEYACVCGPGHERIGAQCVPCQLGFYKGGFSLDPCTPCPANKTTDHRKSTSLSQCRLMAGMQTCPELEPIQNGFLFYVDGPRTDEITPTGIPCQNVKDGHSCHYACAEGYWLDGMPIMICKDTGEWRGQPPVCRMVDCGGIEMQRWPVIQNAQLSLLNETSTYQSMIVVTCLDNTVAIGNPIWTCDRHGQWTKPWNFQCSRVFCGPVKLGPYIKTTSQCATAKQEYSTQCSLTCKRGFELEGPDTLTCDFTRMPVWSPAETPVCKDVEPPTITCPGPLTFMVNNWNESTVVIHVDKNAAVVADNSDNYTLSVNLPSDNQFRVGTTPVTYRVTDGSGLTASCSQDIIVQQKRAKLVTCPGDITTVTDSSKGKQGVVWSDPVFQDASNTTLSFECDHRHTEVFAVGTHELSCWPSGHKTALQCKFNIIVEDLACEVPNINNLPDNGALICGRPEDGAYARVCRVHCKKGTQLTSHSHDHEFHCDWSGRWEMPSNGVWPDCSRTRNPSVALMVNEIHVAYEGDCRQIREDIAEAFRVSIEKILHENGLCKEKHTCTVTDVDVLCGGKRRKRRVVQLTTSADFPANTFPTTTVAADRATVPRFSTVESHTLTHDKETRTHDIMEDIKVTTEILYELTTEKDLEDTVVYSADYDSTTKQPELTTQKRGYRPTTGTFVESETHTVASDITTQFDHTVDHTTQVGYSPSIPESSVQGGLNIKFTISAEINNKSEIEITKEDQKHLIQDLDAIYFALYDAVTLGAVVLILERTNETATATTLVDGSLPEFVGDCEQGNVKEEEYNWRTCYKCPTGTYFMNNTCEPCELGYYQDLEGQDSCKMCPDNTTTSVIGAKYFCDCMEGNTTMDLYSASHHVNNANQCYVCSDERDNTTCDATAAFCGPVCLHGVCDHKTSNVTNNGDPVMRCLCDPGFTGVTCDTPLDDCWHITCQNNGTCELTTYSFVCLCTEGYNGNYCGEEVSLCASDPCFRGFCVEEAGYSYSCVCEDGWVGAHCDVRELSCYSNPCYYGNCTVSTSGLECICEEGYRGELCEYVVDECWLEPCQHNGTCVMVNNSATCVCPEQWTGRQCESAVDVCDGHDCENEGTCEDMDGTPVCRCQDKYAGKYCEILVDTTFDLVFPRSDPNDFVALRPVSRSLDKLSVCVWLRTNDAHRFGTVLSYSVPSDLLCARPIDAFTIHDIGMLQILVNGEKANTYMSLNNGYWHHVCVTWQSVRGAWNMYINGTARAVGQRLAADTRIEQYGYLVLGQRQNSAGNAYNSRFSFKGELHQLEMYNTFLSEEQIRQVFQKRTDLSTHLRGDLVTWNSVIGHFHGQVAMRNKTWCLDVNECLNRDVCPGENQQCVDLLGSYRCDVIPANSCRRVPCQNGGQCVSNEARPDDPGVCLCPPKYTGRYCESELTCALLQCLNNGTCDRGGQEGTGPARCVCPLGYTGTRCEQGSTNPCDSVHCQNGGECTGTASGEYKCICKANWKGKYCQTYFTPTCVHTPCLNGGSCELDPTRSEGYRCVCTNPGIMGPNCEVLPCVSNPCLNNATCTQNGEDYICQCSPHFTGVNCEIAITTTSPIVNTTTTSTTPPFSAAPINLCQGIDCKNNGQCVNKETHFHCECTIDFKGQYCQTRRKSQTRTYAVRVSLKQDYNPNLPYNESFKREFSNAIHVVYRPVTFDSKLSVDIRKISPGSVLVDFDLHHTIFDDSSAAGSEAMKHRLQDQLMRGRLGSFDASMEKFQFQLVTASEAGAPWWGFVLLAIVSGLLVVVIVSTCVCFRKRRRQQKPIELNNFSDVVKSRIRNPVSGSPQTIRMQPYVHDDIYSDPIETPYAVTRLSEVENKSNEKKEDTLGRRYPSKRGKDVNKDWASNRSAMPLPPTPNENQKSATANSMDAIKKGVACCGMSEKFGTAASGGTSNDPHYRKPRSHPMMTPPPPYRDAMLKTLKMNNANINPSGHERTSEPNLYTGGAESVYITPLSDELSPKPTAKRRASDFITGSKGDNGVDASRQLSFDEEICGGSTYLIPRAKRIASDHESEDGYAPDIDGAQAACEVTSTEDTPLLNREKSGSLNENKGKADQGFDSKSSSMDRHNKVIGGDGYWHMNKPHPSSSISAEYLTPVNLQKSSKDTKDLRSGRPKSVEIASEYLNSSSATRSKKDGENKDGDTVEYLTQIGSPPGPTYVNQIDRNKFNDKH